MQIDDALPVFNPVQAPAAHPIYAAQPQRAAVTRRPACPPTTQVASVCSCPHNLQPGRNEQLCILALPADMGFAELCTFMGAYFTHASLHTCKPVGGLGRENALLCTACRPLCTNNGCYFCRPAGPLHKVHSQPPPGHAGTIARCAPPDAHWVPSSLHTQVREIRLVRREGRSSVCLVLLRFDAQASADGFYRDFNGRPVGCPCLVAQCRCALA